MAHVSRTSRPTMPHTDAVVVLTTVATADEGAALVRALLERRLIACGSLLPGSRSLYRWEGKIADEQETVVLMKTRSAVLHAIEKAFAELHPYKVPELLALEVRWGLERYVNWINDETSMALLAVAVSTCSPSPTSPARFRLMQIDVSIDDLAFVAAGAIARPVNAELRAVTPVIRRLEVAAGEALERSLRVQQPLEVGAAVVTGAGALAAELMIHAVVSSEVEAVSRDGVRRATASAMQRAHDFGVETLAIAPFGLGAGNLEVEDSAREMLSAMHAHAARSARPSRVVVVVESAWEGDAFEAALAFAARGA